MQTAAHPHQEHVSVRIERTALATLAELAVGSHIDVVVDGHGDVNTLGEQMAKV